MSRLLVARYTSHDLRPSGSSKNRNHHGTHLTYGYTDSDIPEITEVRRVIKEAPESSWREMSVRIERIAVIGQKLHSVSLGAIFMPNSDLSDEIDYFSQQLNLTRPHEPHITLATGLANEDEVKKARAEIEKDLIKRGLTHSALRLRPVTPRFNSGYTKTSPSNHSASTV